MGIHDRHYVRREASSGGLRGSAVGVMRMWSANTWIIVLCIAVFVTDSFMPISTWKPVHVADTLPAHVQFVSGQYVEQKVDEEQPGRPFARVVFDISNPDAPQKVGEILYSPMPPLMRGLHFSTTLGFLGVQFWRFIGFQFLHANISHILFNMLGLYFFGSLVERNLGGKRFLAFYLLCGICGALMFLLLNLGGIVVSLMSDESVRIPGLLFNSPHTPLVGASAGVFGVLMAGAYLAPRAEVLLFFIIPMQLRTLAYALVVIALFTVITGGGNAGGEAGHLGGAIAGFYFIRRPHHLHGFFDILGWLDPTSHHYRDKTFRPPSEPPPRRPTDSAEIDRILDKIRDQGLGSLTAHEKRILKDASRE